MERRAFLTGSLAVTGGVALTGTTALPASATESGGPIRLVGGARATGHYTANRAPLQKEAFLRLPPGSIIPKGWLRTQLDLQLNGLNGRMPEVSDYLTADSGWAVPSGVGWEELPYWLRGFGDLGYVTGDAATLELTKTWMDRILATRQSDGFFGPTSLRTSLNGLPDFWPYMPVLDAMRTWYEYSADDRIIDTLTGWLKFLDGLPGTQFGQGWGSARVGDTIDTAYWLYNRTGDAFLLDLVRTVHANSADYTHTIPTWHNVNLAQGFREPAQYGVLAGDPSFLAATHRVYDTVMGTYGQFPGGGFAGDENVRFGFHDPRQGFETCGVVEFMHSHELLTRITGDSLWTDRCEELALNTLPAALDPQHKGTHYVTGANTVQLDNVPKSHGQFNNSFAMQAYMPGIHQYRCCPHNYGMGWPYYAEEMWLASTDGGLCASLYAESSVRAKVGPAGGTEVTVTEQTAYPFDDTVTLTLSTPRPVRFPLYLRVPGWCQDPSVRIGGRPVKAATSGGYLVLDRTWQHRDTVQLRLPMRTTVRTWGVNDDGVSVAHGPLTYSLQIEEDWQQFAGTADWPEYEVRPASPWNYALEVDARDPARSFTFEHTRAAAADPFTQTGTPVRMRAKGRRLIAWQVDDQNVTAPLQPGPARTGETVEQLTLIPAAAARLRVTAFPTVGSGSRATDWAAVSASFSGVDSPQALLMNATAQPTDSYDQSLPRFTWWDHTGTAEWVAYTFAEPVRVSAVSVYWYDDTGHGACRVPQSWVLEYLAPDGSWQPSGGDPGYGTAKGAFVRVAVTPVTTTALRVRVQLQPGVSGGLLTWRVEH
ncbi:beta-L-arabinofuranosidase domain-containing protein [Actinacidiphila oryziradicis]|uniref:Transcriptional initiation protein Tat n=1 Tax=Actinacidiphila oryziradicis TaxID=2571141 RepID=A0A4U0S237_9ACTN|nr:beta-L-arabinofuranosidase domain-containing protein [Actinacidiphila oryziradicis]TKA02233.1 transcriptional initiation protein Tat [Actinacidiphila oryziradicis]